MDLKGKLECILEAYSNVPPCPYCGSYEIINVYDENNKLTNFDECEECGERWRV